MPVDLVKQVLLEVVHGASLLSLVEGEGFQGHGVKVKLSKNGLPIASDEVTRCVTIILGGREGRRERREGGREGGRGSKRGREMEVDKERGKERGR